MLEKEELLKEVPKRLLSWYDRAKRVLPWRENHDPYRIWVSEIMLQQTRVEAAIGYYNRFLEAFPTVSALAEAEQEQVLKLWEGLGYYSRARNMQKAAQIVVDEYGGIFPKTAEKLRALPGIGEYTAGAISSIAYDCPEPAVDGNVLRVVMRILANPLDITRNRTKQEVSRAISAVIPDRAGDFNQSLMELGAMVCLPNGEPLCMKCPLADICEGKRLGIAETLPNKPQKKERTKEKKTVFILLDQEDRAAFIKRPDQGLLAGMWEFPNVEGHLTKQKAKKQLLDWGFCASLSQIEDAVHIFTHREWHMTGYLARIKEDSGGPFLWADKKMVRQELSVPSAFSAFLKRLESEWKEEKQ